MDDMISRTSFRSNIQTVLNDTTCPIHIAAEIEYYLELEPAVDAVPVIHGQWIDENPDDFLDPRLRCSICSKVESPLIKWRYCPNCGAKMDGEWRNENATG